MNIKRCIKLLSISSLLLLNSCSYLPFIIETAEVIEEAEKIEKEKSN